MNQTYTLPRTGMPAITFHGKLLVSANGREQPRCARLSRWHEIAVYRIGDSGRYLVHVGLRCSTKHDAPNDQVAIFDEPTDAIDWLWKFDCTAAVHGWPKPEHAERDNSLRDALENYFDRMVSQIQVVVPEFAVPVT